MRHHVWSGVCVYSWYATVRQTELTADLKVPTCPRTNTNLCVLYLFMTCSRPLDPNRYKRSLTRRPYPQDPNRMSGTTSAKLRTKSPPATEEDEKISTVEDERPNVGVTIAEVSRRTWHHNMLLNWKSLPLYPHTEIVLSSIAKCCSDSVKYIMALGVVLSELDIVARLKAG